MKLIVWVTAIAAPLAVASTVSFGGPQLEEKEKPGYPYPGTKATDEYGKAAEKAGTMEVNREEMRGSGHPGSGMSPDRPGYPFPGPNPPKSRQQAKDSGTREVNKEETQGGR